MVLNSTNAWFLLTPICGRGQRAVGAPGHHTPAPVWATAWAGSGKAECETGCQPPFGTWHSSRVPRGAPAGSTPPPASELPSRRPVLPPLPRVIPAARTPMCPHSNCSQADILCKRVTCRGKAGKAGKAGRAHPRLDGDHLPPRRAELAQLIVLSDRSAHSARRSEPLRSAGEGQQRQAAAANSRARLQGLCTRAAARRRRTVTSNGRLRRCMTLEGCWNCGCELCW